eukprot:179272_1
MSIKTTFNIVSNRLKKIAMESSSDSGDDDTGDFDILEAFDSITFIEEEFISEGKDMGRKIVSERSYNEGYNTGKIEGSKLGEELGFYHGFISYLQFNKTDNTKQNNANAIELSAKSEKAVTKISKQLNKLSLSSKYLIENDTKIKECMVIIRSTFKSLLISTNLLQMFQSLDDDSVPESIKALFKEKTNKSSDVLSF